MFDCPTRPLSTIALACALLSSCVPDARRADRIDAEFLRIVAAEDARPDGGPELQVLVDGTRHDLAAVRHAAVRALGRLERPELLEHVAPLLDDPSPAVRGSAANAVAQAFHTSPDATAAADLLFGRIDAERDPEVRGTVARSLGRLAVDARTRGRIADVLVEASRTDGGDAPAATLLGVALGLEQLIRSHPGDGISGRVATRLRELAVYPTRRIGDQTPGRIRALSVNALGIAGRLELSLFLIALRDQAPEVGINAARHLDVIPALQRDEMLRRVASHRLSYVAIEGLRRLRSVPLDMSRCQLLLSGIEALQPGSLPIAPPVAVLAVQALDRPCPDIERQIELLTWAASRVDAADVPWQASSHALLSLARLSPADARVVLPAHVGHGSGFVRAYAAQAAGLLEDRAVLGDLAVDADPNVRTAAITALVELEGRAADPVVRAQLAQDDPQLLLTAARLLEGTADRSSAADAALAAFRRISAAGRETWRDPRRALLDLLADVGGGPGHAAALQPYLEDYDPVVAHDVASLLTVWTRREHVAAPRPVRRAAIPTPERLRELDGARVRLVMAGGGTIEIELHPRLATTNVARFARLVEEGYFDGLTFHRWAPNFVIQGGSPSANEYQGAAAYSRDEVGLLSHWRGTVGISTRGRDTGDAQIFVNLHDNVRLDHDYTIVGTVVEGMDVVDVVLEGTVIERAELIRAERVAGM